MKTDQEQNLSTSEVKGIAIADPTHIKNIIRKYYEKLISVSSTI